MKKILLCGLLVAVGVFGQEVRTATLSYKVGTTNYYGTATTSRKAAPSTNDYVWAVEQVVTDTEGVFVSSKWAFGLIDGVVSYDAIRWSDILSTNVVYR